MQKYILQTVFFSCMTVAGILYLAGCSKNEHPIEEARFTNLEFKAFSVDTLRLKVVANETVLTDSLFAPAETKNIRVQYFDPKHQIRLYDVFNNRLWLDTVINYKPGFSNSLTFFQPSAGENFIWIGPPVNESLPPANYAKISIRYTHTILPDLLKVVVENNTSGTAYSATDSFELRKNEFSRYFLGYNGTTRKVRLKLYSTDSRRKQLAWAEEGDFATVKSSDYNIYVFRKKGSTVDSFRIIGEKLY
jgi:hypothetical protein